MKVLIEIDESLDEAEVVIRCSQYDDSVKTIHQLLSKQTSSYPQFEFFKGNEEFFLTLNDIIFFETSGDAIYGHTHDDAFQIKIRLYELEQMLPSNFTRISKSSILNIIHVKSIERKLNSSSLVQFRESHKEVYVSRLYYKGLKEKMKERRYYEK